MSNIDPVKLILFLISMAFILPVFYRLYKDQN